MKNISTEKESIKCEDEKLTINDHSEDIVVSYSSEGNPYSYYKDDRWVLFDKGADIKFHRLHGSFKEAIKHIIHEKIIVQNEILSSTTYSLNWMEGAIRCQKVIQELGGESYRFIDSDEGFRSFISHAKSLKIRYKTWKNTLIILSKLYEYKFIDRKIDSSELLAKQLSSLNGITQQSTAIPEKIAAAYIHSSMDVIERYYPYRFSISEAYKNFMKHRDECKKKYSCVVTSRKKAQELTLHDIPFEDFNLDPTGAWLSWLRGACYTLIASFTGCRDGEIKSFGLDSYQEEEYGGISIATVTGTHTKPIIAGVKREASWVTIETTKKAIELLWHSFEFAREIWTERSKEIKHEDVRQKMLDDINSLFLTLPYRTTTTRPAAGCQSISGSLASFAKSVGYFVTHDDIKEFNTLNPTRKGELIEGQVLIPHPHGFRRTFAIFLVRNKLGSLLDLKYQFKHLNLAMAAWYANHANMSAHLDMIMDKELMDLIAEENVNFMTDTLYYIYNDATTLSGKEGKRITKAREGLPTSIYMSREEILNQVKNGQMSIVENPFGHCTNPACSRICDMQICKYKIVTKEKALTLLPVRNQLIEKYKAMKNWGVNQPNIMSKIYYDIKAIDQSLVDHEIEFSSFNETLSVPLLQGSSRNENQ